MARQGDDRRLYRFADRLEEDACSVWKPGEDAQHQEDAEALLREFVIQGVLGTEQVDDALREKLEHYEAHGGDYSRTKDGKQVRLFHPQEIARPVVKADDWLRADTEADHKRQAISGRPHHDAECGERDIGTVNGRRAVLHDHVVGNEDGDRDGDLRDEAGDAVPIIVFAVRKDSFISLRET